MWSPRDGSPPFPYELLVLSEPAEKLRHTFARMIVLTRWLARHHVPAWAQSGIIWVSSLFRFQALQRFNETADQTIETPDELTAWVMTPRRTLLRRQQERWKWHAAHCSNCEAILRAWEAAQRGEALEDGVRVYELKEAGPGTSKPSPL